MKGSLADFSAISVRESTGIDICKQVFEQNAIHVLDPTLLIGQGFFEKIINSEKNIHNKSYNDLVFYKLDKDAFFDEFVHNLSQNNNWTIEDIYYRKVQGNYYYNEVHDWLAKIKNSKFVITDSFHCVCFAILFQKEFLYYPNNKNRGMSRITSLMEQLEIGNRIYCVDSTLGENLSLLSDEIDFIKVEILLSELREKSKIFLKNSLS